MRTNGLYKITKWLLILILMMLTVSACSGINHPTTENDQHLEIIRIQGPLPIPFALPLISAIEHHALDAYATKIEYKTWKNPDELKARIISNQADIFAVPTYAAANLYNRQLNVNYVATIVWGYLYMIGPEQELITWDALKEETIYIPHKGHVADLVFQYLARQNGLDPKKDLSVHYVSGPNEAVAQLIMGNAKYAIISEHAATLAVIKGKKEGIALDKVMDLQEEWAKATGKDAEIPIGGILISGEFMQKHPDIVEALTNALKHEITWIRQHPLAAGELAEKYVEGISKEMVAQVIPSVTFEYKATKEAQEELAFFFEEISKISNEIIGGKLPDENFYSQ